MSGFGGFGSSPFGSSNQQQSSTFGNNNGGFGNTPAAQSGFGFTSSATTPAAPSFGFGSSATIPGTGFFGSGGVTSPTQPFGTSSFSSPQPSFGTSSSVSPFATATATTPQAPFGTSTATGSSGLFGTNTSIAVAPTASNGFGGPSFLSSQPPPNPGFGTSTQVPTAGPFGGTTFGSQGPLTTTTPNPAPFFAAPPAPTGSSFTQSTQPFGSSLTFGTSSTFGQQSFSTNPFGNNASNGPTSSSIFGGSNSVAPSGFGTNNNTNSSLPFGSNGGVFGVTGSTSVTTTQATGLLGTSSNVNPFGSSTNTTTPQFGTAPTNNLAATFGTSNSSISTPAAPFGSTSSATPLFGTSPFNQQQSNNLSSPFGMSNQQQPASAGMTFSSSNGASGFMSTNNTFGSTSVAYPLFNTPSQSDLDMRTSPVPTTMSPLNTSPMRTAGGQSDSEDMGDADDGSKAPLANLPFGRPVAPTSTTTTGTWGSSTGNNPFASNTSAQSMPVSTPFGQSPALSSIPESEAIMDSTQDQIPVAAVANSELLRLKAKLELKKKKLKEKQLKEESSQQVPSTSTSTSGLSQADRNAIRFAKNNTVTAPLTPPTFQATSDIAPGAIVTSTNREELENAVSLVGTCMRMCPDEEIERRERESDIQLLEKPLPGTIHPTGWTIRETMVKRFRRSAADYKLDVPEWVRPPDVLEVVCGYLEEWVMERDRQGPDQRFLESSFNFDDGIPPSLDVYQFIWDRTRMVRKDFILQNYVGTGGNCDARAVRCHERIARWHAMCEHQLSHIPEFIKQQSQQNIQELGQTMKTLNQYYDDSLNRSIVEVPDEQGNETRQNLPDFNHGCTHNAVQGPTPVDFDQTDLRNDNTMDAANRRLIGGRAAVTSAHHGTAEPEMRGLYILLTLENDGGMEVLKYAARLYQLRPNVYQSSPVQLALNIYKSRKECNYARFFSILRSPATPYLFGCIMFKYVELMRKSAFCVMAKTYGGKTRDELPIYDAYPLAKLTYLLCFEDDDEAREACKHYNITVKDDSGDETIFWRHSPFKEPRDPEKGTVIRLLPRKMTRTIENKARGVTRLGVCRGEVSGDGAFHLFETLEEKAKREDAAKEAERIAREIELVRRRKQEEVESTRRRMEEKKRKEMEMIRIAELERKRIEEEQRQREIELQERREEEERKRKENERLQKEIEEKKKEQEIEAARLRAEAAEMERQNEIRQREAQRLEAERIKQEERRIALERRLQEEAAEKLRKEEFIRRLKEEQKRMEEEEVEKQRIEDARLRREARIRAAQEQEREAAEALRLRREAQERVSAAKTKLILLRWLQKLPQESRVKDNIAGRLSQISPLANSHTPFDFDRGINSNIAERGLENNGRSSILRRTVERLLRCENEFLSDLTKRILDEIDGSYQYPQNHTSKVTLLVKIAIILPIASSYFDQSLCDLIRTWFNSRFRFQHVNQLQRECFDIRVVFVDGHDISAHSESDAVVFIVPPPWSDHPENHQLGTELHRMNTTVDPDVPRVIFSLSEKLEATTRKEYIAPILGGDYSEVFWIENSSLEGNHLDECVASLCDLLTRLVTTSDRKIVERTSLEEISLQFLREVFVDRFSEESGDNLPMKCQKMLQRLVDEMYAMVAADGLECCSWPAAEFARNGNEVENYFHSNNGLPMDWISSMSRENLSLALLEITSKLNGSLVDVIWGLMRNAPYPIQSECQRLFDEREFTKCLWNAIAWHIQNNENECLMHILYLPLGFSREVIERIRIELNEESTVESTLQTVKPANDDTDNVQTTVGVHFPADAFPASNVTKFPNHHVDTVEETVDINNEAAIYHERVNDDRYDKKRPFSRELRDSMNFTKRLKRYLTGEQVKDMIIGRTTLSASIRSAPPLELISNSP